MPPTKAGPPAARVEHPRAQHLHIRLKSGLDKKGAAVSSGSRLLNSWEIALLTDMAGSRPCL